MNFSVSGFFSGGRSGDDTLDGGVTGPSYGGCRKNSLEKFSDSGKVFLWRWKVLKLYVMKVGWLERDLATRWVAGK